MAILSRVGQSSRGMRLLVIMLYLVLGAGAVTMVYPFLLMLSTSVTSKVDVDEYRVVPRYFYQDPILFAKFAEEKYYLDAPSLNGAYATNLFDFRELPKTLAPLLEKVRALPPTALNNRLRDYREFLDTLPLGYKSVGYLSTPGMTGPLQREYTAFIRKKFNDDLKSCAAAYQEEALRFGAVEMPRERLLARDYVPENSAKYRDFLEFKRALPEASLIVAAIEPKFQEYLARKFDSSFSDVKNLNKALKTNYAALSDLRLTQSAPANDTALRELWSEYVRLRLPMTFIGVTDGKQRFSAYLASINRNVPEIELWDTNVRAGVDRPRLDAFGELAGPLYEFIRKEDPENLRVLSAENLYRDFLEQKHGSVAALNQAHSSDLFSFTAASLPALEADLDHFSSRTGELRWHFIARNYREVLDYLFLHGRAAWNTFVFVALTMITGLTVNPLAAYALSRFQLSYTNKILLFCLATMAFPPEVGMIPSFLMLRSFPAAQLVVGLLSGLFVFGALAMILRGKAPLWIAVAFGLALGTVSALVTPIAESGSVSLLNSYWALILPGVANGFSIFMFKGFFDSQPRELYEAAAMEGASELRMFFQITLPLCAPVMAVIGLEMFKSAYSAFMFALLVCQKEETWTLMVYLYQMQQWAPNYVLIAALTLAAIPTLIAILVAQRFILRGIVLPSMH
ncbi:MAG TPA: hypothetical protein VEJ63_12695 [Planctomycetota bacterium]|nr:hypothetical protein [Planctomycetota bacterium]